MDLAVEEVSADLEERFFFSFLSPLFLVLEEELFLSFTFSFLGFSSSSSCVEGVGGEGREALVLVLED